MSSTFSLIICYEVFGTFMRWHWIHFFLSSSTIWVVLWGEIFLQPPPPFPHFSLPTSYLFSGNSIFVLLQTRIEQSDDEMSSLSPRQQHTALLTSLTPTGTGRRQWGSTCCAFFVSKEGTISGGWCHQEFLKAGVVLCAWYAACTLKHGLRDSWKWNT